MNSLNFSRRGFLKVSAGIAAAAVPTGAVYWAKRKPIRLALIGAGFRGSALATDNRAAGFSTFHRSLVDVCVVDLQTSAQTA